MSEHGPELTWRNACSAGACTSCQRQHVVILEITPRTRGFVARLCPKCLNEILAVAGPGQLKSGDTWPPAVSGVPQAIQHQMIVNPLIQINDNLILNRASIKHADYCSPRTVLWFMDGNSRDVYDPDKKFWHALANGTEYTMEEKK